MGDQNKEEAYDSAINPLMAQILEVCKQHGIAMFASFYIPTPDDPDLCCTSCLPDGDGNTPDYLLRASRAAMASSEAFAITITKGQP